MAAYTTESGAAFCGDSRELLAAVPDDSVNLVMTSPPFALQRQKAYGNKEQHEYVGWLKEFGRVVHRKLTPDGSFVLDLGGVSEGHAGSQPLQLPRAAGPWGHASTCGRFLSNRDWVPLRSCRRGVLRSDHLFRLSFHTVPVRQKEREAF